MAIIKINKENYKYNLTQIAKKAKGFDKVIYVLKDNAYGHGALLLAPIIKEMGIEKIAVKNEIEACELKDFFNDILIFSHTCSCWD